MPRLLERRRLARRRRGRDRIRRRPLPACCGPALSIWPSRSPCCSDWPSWIEKAAQLARDRRAQVELVEARGRSPRLGLSEAVDARSCASWLDCSASSSAMPRRMTSPALLVIEVVRGVVEHLAGDKALFRQRPLHVVQPLRLARSRSASISARSLAMRVCCSASSWLRILLNCCSTSVWRARVDSCRSALERSASSWPLTTVAPSSTYNFLDPAALDRVEDRR